MSRLPTLMALAIACAPVTAAAQTEFNVLLAEVDGETSSTELGRPFNAYHCANAASIPVVVTMGSGSISGTLDMWIGGTSIACESGGNRDSNPLDSICETLGPTPTTVNSDREVLLTFADMLGTKVDPCANSAATGAAYRLYFFESMGETPYLTDPVGVNWGYLGGTKTGTGQFVVDTQAPAPPAVTATDVVGQRPTIRWDVPGGMETQLTYMAYVVESGGACGGGATDGGLDGGALDGGALDGGTPDGGTLDGGTGPTSPVPAYDHVLEFGGNGRTSAAIPLGDLGIAPGTTVTIYMTVLDFALNESAPSTPVCATYLPTGDFCTISGDCGDLCSCAVPGAPRRARPPFALLAALPLLGLWFARRRRPR